MILKTEHRRLCVILANLIAKEKNEAIKQMLWRKFKAA